MGIGQILCISSLLRTAPTLTLRIERKKAPSRPRIVTFDWMIDTGNRRGYIIKFRKTQNREEHHCFILGPVHEQKKKTFPCLNSQTATDTAESEAEERPL